MKKILEEFKAFALKGNMIDMAVADHRRRVQQPDHLSG